MAADNEREVWTRIIDVYKDRPHMWDKKHKHYFNRDMRQQTFELMFEIFRELENNIDISSFKKKFENMRTSFSRELKKVNASKRTGSGSNDVYKPSLWYYNLFTFTEETTEPSRRGIDSIDTDTMDPEEALQDYELNEPSSSQAINLKEETAPKKHRLTLQKKQEKLFDTAQKLLTTSDDWEIIGTSYGRQLKDLSKHQQVVAKKLISDVIFYGQLEKLTEESTISLRNQYHTSYIQSTLPNSFQRYKFSSDSSTGTPIHTPSPQHQAYAPVPTPSPQHQAYAPVPTPSPQHQAQAPVHTPSPQHQAYAPVPTPSPQHQAYAPVPTPSPQHQAYAPVPTPSPQHQAQAPVHTPSPQHQAYAPVPTPSPRHQAYAPVPTPSPQHQAYAPVPTPSPQHQAQAPVHTPSPQHQVQAPVPQHQSQLCELSQQYPDTDLTNIDNIDITNDFPNTTFSNNNTVVEGTVNQLKDFLLFKRK